MALIFDLSNIFYRNYGNYISGVNCTVDVEECASSPCQHNAQCIDDVDGFTCNCTGGYHGPLCESDVDLCAEGVRVLLH